ncbi:hypothetical protein LMH87_009632 [Akanthomyces muscarius]|uniref:Glucan 1, 4-alpha-glucosidase n=1 Tax=Akanthomyces muscarius TaxID=2231603 RepID=A0A9W8QDW8_AKAMU|nr:hypothetical protein LMH87_009632 [Akanthomyces muscarius]KAJ4153128.1 hypothetical protein LMH87_009632 [Akanthomyces muscarius]
MSVMASRPPNMPAGAGGSKRPRLSLQIKSSSSSASASTTSNRPASRGFSLNPSDPTAFNTLSNAYVTAIERASTPVTSPVAVREPLTAINTFQAISLYSPISARPASAYPATPLSAHTSSQPSVVLPLPSVMSPTPPLSAGAVDSTGGSKIFSFSPRDSAAGRHSLEQALHAAASSAAAATTPSSPMATPPKQRPAVRTGGLSGSPPPYTHAKALRSILRNSPLPSRRPASAPSPRPRFAPTVRIQVEEDSARRQQQQRAAKRVCYHSPIEQEITTNMYTKSHIDLLVEEATTTTSPRHLPVDLSRAFSANEIQDGGQTPGPFEDESRRLGAAMRASPGDAASKGAPAARGEKKRRWVWTIGRDADEEEDADVDEEQLGGAVVAAARAAAAAAGGTQTAAARAPMLSVPRPRMKLDTRMTGVEMS